MAEQFSTFDEVHQEIDSKIILENVVHADNEWMLDIVEDVFLKLQAVKKVLVNDNILSYSFHGVHLLRLSVLNKENFAECSFAKHSLNLEILQPDALFGYVSFASEYKSAALSHSCTSSCRFRPIRDGTFIIVQDVIITIWLVIEILLSLATWIVFTRFIGIICFSVLQLRLIVHGVLEGFLFVFFVD